ncbi:MAG TPA: glycosyltransferase family 9 protein [Opitutaceae bacterium]|jgi:ADP-heptose:LPS heptosyltransferase|nr:glycosyltransferase family 9 protein [Opitutaceae bacterium]
MAPQQKILVIRRRYLGDVVLLGSLLRNLKLHWPGCRIVAAVEPGYAGILGLNPDVDAVISPPSGAAGWFAFARKVRAEKFSHVLDIDNTERTALIARLSGAPFRLALHHGTHPIRMRVMYTDVVHEHESEHENQPITDYYLKALGPMGVPVATRDIRLEAREADIAEWGRYVGAQGRTLLVHPGSRSEMRIWPAQNFAAVCDRVQDELGVQVVLAGGPAEFKLIQNIKDLMRTHVIAPGAIKTQPLFAALAKASTAFLCHDSGPMHVAAAVGTPVIALYGSQNPKLFRPTGSGHRLIIPPMPCADCVSPSICVPSDSYRNLCVRRNSIDDVYAAVRDVLSGIS